MKFTDYSRSPVVRFWKWLDWDERDVLAFTGLFFVAVGVWFIYRPGSLIAFGLGLIYFTRGTRLND